MGTLWRLHVSQEAQVQVEDRCRFCVDSGIAGLGWSVGEISNGLMDWAEYTAKANTKFQQVSKSVNWFKKAAIGDLLWTRDTQRIYWLGRLEGEWTYRFDEAHKNADIHNVRACNWVRVGDLTQVPGAIQNAMILGPALRNIRSEMARRFSMDTFNRLSGQEIYALPTLNGDASMFDLFDPDDCEDLVGIYLQQNDWVVYPSSCKKYTPLFEFVSRHRVTGREAAVQVKQGNAPIEVSQYEDFDGDVFLFQTRNRYEGLPKRAATKLLDPAEMMAFCMANLPLMTKSIQRRVEWMKG